MPLSGSDPRREIHHRVIDMKTYARADGLYDIEARLVDRKPFAFSRLMAPEPLPAGQALHDLWIRLTVDNQFVVRNVEAASDATPFSVCREATSTLTAIIGERIGSGWSKRVKEHLRGAASCTHLMEMLIPMATTALQGIHGLNAQRNATSPEARVVRHKLDSCYAFGRSSEVVKSLWPEHYRPSEGPSTEADKT